MFCSLFLPKLVCVVVITYFFCSDARLQDDLNLSDESDDEAKRESTDSAIKLPVKKYV